MDTISVFSAPSSPELQAHTNHNEKEDDDAAKGFVLVAGPPPLNLHSSDAAGFSFRSTAWSLALGADANAVAEVKLLVPAGGHGLAAKAAGGSWALLVSGPGPDEARTILLAPRPATADGDDSLLSRPVIFADHGLRAGAGEVTVCLQIGGCQVGTGPEARKTARFADLSAAAAPAKAGLQALLEAEAGRSQHWAEWAAGSAHRRVPCAAVWPAGVPSRATIEAALLLGRVHPDCFVGPSDCGHVACLPGPALVSSASSDIDATGSWLASGLLDLVGGGGGGGGGDGMQLQLPAETAKVVALRDRLLESAELESAAGQALPPRTSASRAAAAAVAAALLAPKAVLLVLCAGLAAVQQSAAPLLLAACLHCAARLLGDMAACEQKWLALETAFAAWQQQQQQRTGGGAGGLRVPDLPRLLSPDGPWRGNYEEACRFTAAQSGRSSTQAAALALLLGAGWFAAELHYDDSPPGGDPAAALAAAAVGPDVLLCAGLVAAVVALVLWQAAALTTRQTDQSANLYTLHLLKVEVLARALQPVGHGPPQPLPQPRRSRGGDTDDTDDVAAAAAAAAAEAVVAAAQTQRQTEQHQHQQRVAAAMAAKAAFEMEYALVKEYMALNAATANGCFTLLPECRVTRPHALTAATVALPAVLRQLTGRPGAAVLLGSSVWLCFALALAAAVFAVLSAAAPELWPSRGWLACTARETAAASRRIVATSCRQGTLVVVAAAVVVRAVQLHRAN
eukprot:SAG22_NODE_1950_length_3271_cov_3.362547_2_plen_739_part_00